MKDAAALYLENQLCFPLYAASRLTTKLYAPILKELDLTYPQYLVLMVLWQDGAQSVNTLGARLLLESNTLTPLLKRMEQKKLIQRTRSKEDERSVRIELTKDGFNLKERALEIPEKIISSFNNPEIETSELKAFQQTLWKLVRALGSDQ